MVSVIPSVQKAQVAEQDACKTLYSLTPVVVELHEQFMFSNPSAVMLAALGKQGKNNLVELETAMLASLRKTKKDAVAEGVVIASQIASAEKELVGMCEVLRKRISALEKRLVTN